MLGKRSKHSLSHYNLFTCDMGKLIPFSCIETLPGDTFDVRTQMLIRVTPQAAPVMHPVVARVHWFHVPMRQLDIAETFIFEDFITGGADGDDSQTMPQYGPVDVEEGSPADYLGIPPGTGRSYNRGPIDAYFRVWDQWYRDQDLMAAHAGSSGRTAASLKKIAWEKDYFTDARPWAQKGTAVSLPIGDVVGDGNDPTFSFNSGAQTGVKLDGPSGASAQWDASITVPSAAGWDDPHLIANIGDVREIREAFALQRYQEARALYGSRYTEYLRYLGVRSSDARLNEPEYLGGGRALVQFSEVVQTAPETDQTSPTEYGTGDLYGHGIAAIGGRPFRRFFEEHGYMIGLLSVRPKAMYPDGLEKMWLRQDKEDFFQKELQFIGAQEITDQEVYADAADPDGIFGYGDRYREYQECRSRIAGDFRSTLDYWHLARLLASEPNLNQSFVECTPSKRVFNEQTYHSLWCMANNKIKARRLVRSGRGSRIA